MGGRGLKILADTSIWIRYLRRGQDETSSRLDRLIGEGTVVACGPVLSELMWGTPPESREAVWSALTAMEWAGIDASSWRRAGEAAYALRRRGRTVALIDLAIAVAAIGADAKIWTLDKDFEHIRDVLPELSIYRPG